jgi:hypothetical protein
MDPTMRKSIALFLLGLAAARVGAAGELTCAPESAPLVELNFADSYAGGYDSSAFLLCRDGRITVSRTLVGTSFTPGFGASVTHGRVPRETLTVIHRALTEARAGSLTDCNTTGSVDGTLDSLITWFGRSRQNTFVMHGGAIGEPRCAPETDALRNALLSLRDPAGLENAEILRIPSTIDW